MMKNKCDFCGINKGSINIKQVLHICKICYITISSSIPTYIPKEQHLKYLVLNSK